MNTITSPQGIITVPVTTDGKYYVLGPVSLPEIRDRESIDQCHRDRLTRSASKAKKWAERAEAWLLVHGKGARKRRGFIG